MDIYVSYDKKDKKYGDIIVKLLQEKNFTVWTDENSAHIPYDALSNSAIYGVYIMLITENSLEHNQKDVEYILNYYNGGETILPIFIGENKLSPEDENWYRSGRHFDLTANPSISDFTVFVNFMEQYTKASNEKL